jgi:hypothetical protein
LDDTIDLVSRDVDSIKAGRMRPLRSLDAEQNSPLDNDLDLANVQVDRIEM